MRLATLPWAVAVLGSATPPLLSAPPYTGTVPPIGVPRATVPPSLPPGGIKIDPSLLDVQMNFDLSHAVVTKNPSGLSLKFPEAPTTTSQGWILNLFALGIVYPAGGAGGSTAHMVFSATNNLATADLRSNAFELAKRSAVVLDWTGYFEEVNFPIQINLRVGQDQFIGSVTFEKGQVLVGPAGKSVPIGTFVVGQFGHAVQHRVLIRSDLVARTYTVRFRQSGQEVVSPPIPFESGIGPVPTGMQQVTARLTSPKPYVLGSYDISRVSLSGEPK